MHVRTKLVVANWKMNGSLAANAAWVEQFAAKPRLSGVELAVCPPSVYLPTVSAKIAEAGLNIAVGAQNCSAHKNGAYTGEISPEMLSDIGCSWVILGHSERRQMFGETNHGVAEKVYRAIQAGLRPILCLGETLEELEAGRTFDIVGEQLDAVLDRVGAQALAEVGAVAYEPVWAIGTGKTATPQQAELVHATLRDRVEFRDPVAAEKLRILYGGSVKPENAAELFACNDIDGGLIGGAGLKADDFYEIARVAVSL